MKAVGHVLSAALDDLRVALSAQADAQHTYERASGVVTEASKDLSDARHAVEKADARVRALLSGAEHG